jgi:hypothetical protein
MIFNTETSVIFDIDGTVADISHRLHFIDGSKGEKDWDSFFAEENLIKDKPIPETWAILAAILRVHHPRVLFVTGRPERQRHATYRWLTDANCKHRHLAAHYWRFEHHNNTPLLFMRSDTDRRPSHEVKEDLVRRVRASGFNPRIAFEDRKQDADMWRRNGLICYQVAEGDY